MPEGHVIHRLANRLDELLAGHRLHATSPQGRFSAGAEVINGAMVEHFTAHGKHLFGTFTDVPWHLHIHLGLFGKVAFVDPARPATDTVRLRLSRAIGDPKGTGAEVMELRGPTRCELLSDEQAQVVENRLGPDPVYGADNLPERIERAWGRVSRSRRPIAQLLLDQSIVAGAGNIYRAEVLFRARINPLTAGMHVSREEWDGLWTDLVLLMHDGVRTGRIDTVLPEHTPEVMERAPRRDPHGGEVYVYRRDDQPCLVCGQRIAKAELAGRNNYWCPTCQR